MQLICLNLWGGKAFNPLMNFLKKMSVTTDIFCFQEVFDTTSRIKTYDGLRINLHAELKRCLADFRGYFAVSENKRTFTKPVDFPCAFGSAIFVKKKFAAQSHNSFSIGISRNAVWKKSVWKEIAQYVTVICGHTPYTFCNVHGIANWPKTDTPERLEQSHKIIDAINKYKGKKIICGDFNLNPKTESVRMFEKAGMRNLVKEYHIKKTRSNLFYAQMPDSPDKISDYVFVSPDVRVQKFIIPRVAVSDHLPLVLNFV